MSARRTAACNLAAAFLCGPWTLPEMAERGARAWGSSGRWLTRLAEQILEGFGEANKRPDVTTLAGFLEERRDYLTAWESALAWQKMPVHELFCVPPTMAPQHGAPVAWSVPPLATTGELAEWLGLTLGELAWFADCQGREAAAPEGPLRHYTYRWLRSRSGKLRLLERPKARLKALQRRVLHEILDHIPPHEAAHGFRRGRSLLGFVAPHRAQRIVLRLDLRDFFPSIPASRVHALFRTAGYPAEVARLLTGLATNAVPWEVLRAAPCAADVPPVARSLHLRHGPHLPQGAPTSPALANLCAHRLDCRLTALARAAGGCYTRYADDLAFSGGPELERSARRFQVAVCRIALEEGFEVNTRKTRFMRQAVRQQLAGVVVNERPNLARSEYDRLKAILTNCVRHGPAAQNRAGHADFRAHLAGRVAHAAWLNPTRGRRLQELFARIVWDDGPPPART
jgi:hypothetical protein